MRASTFILSVLFAPMCLAVTTSRWKHSSEADFAAGQMDRVVATNLGDLKLSRSVRSILPPDARISAVYALAESSDGTLYAATGPEGVLLRIRDGRAQDEAVLGENVSLFSLRFDRLGRLLVGTGGERGELLRIDKPGEKPVSVFSAEGVQYVWSIYESPDDGTLYLGTGPNGQLWAVKPDGATELIHDADENNLLCVLGEPTGGDLLYLGTDPNGLLLRVNRRTKECFVVYDAAETEVSALAFDPAGHLLAGTSQATPDADVAAVAAEQTGRPDGGAGGVPIEAVPPENPQPPQMPEPAPGEPRPIPKFAVFDDQRPAQPDENNEDDASEQPQPTTAPNVAPTAPVAPSAAGSTEPAANGNAVYRVDRDGFVTELFRANAAFFSLLWQQGQILAATGNNGLLYQLRPAAEETITLAKVDPKQILCLLSSGDGARVFLGCSNRGDIIEMTSGYAESGTYTSPVLDAGQISRFGQLHLRGSLPNGAALSMSTRSGNVADPSAAGWSAWSEVVAAAEYLPVRSPPARFLQYRLTFGSAGGGVTPVVQEVELAYQVPNLPPAVSAVRVVSGDADDPDSRAKRGIGWDAADPNADDLRFTIQYRPAGSDAPWVTIQNDIQEQAYEWDTRTVPDGRYELRVQATDAASNPTGSDRTASRVSDPVMVDNTPPAIGDVEVAKDAAGGLRIRCSVVDRAGTVERLEYAVNGRDQWRLVLPSDMIADSPKEAYSWAVEFAAEGGKVAQIALRATDSTGNQGYLTVPADAVGAHD